MTPLTNILSLRTARSGDKGTLICDILSASEIKSGEKNGKTWRRRMFDIESGDGDGVLKGKLTAFGNCVDKLMISNCYSITNVQAKEYPEGTGKIQYTAGDYSQVELLEQVVEPGQKEPTNTWHEAKAAAAGPPPQQAQSAPPPQLHQRIINAVKEADIDPIRIGAFVAQQHKIEGIVRDTLYALDRVPPHDAKVGLYIKLYNDALERKNNE